MQIDNYFIRPEEVLYFDTYEYSSTDIRLHIVFKNKIEIYIRTSWDDIWEDIKRLKLAIE